MESKSNYDLRKSANIEVPRPRTEIGRSSFKHRAALCWKLLPNSFKNSGVGSFRNSTRENKKLLNSISFEKAARSVSFKSIDFKYS